MYAIHVNVPMRNSNETVSENVNENAALVMSVTMAAVAVVEVAEAVVEVVGAAAAAVVQTQNQHEVVLDIRKLREPYTTQIYMIF